MLKISIMTIVLYAIGTTSAFALDLAGAKNSGVVGEQPDGYLGSVASAPSAEIQALIKDINSKRKAVYEKISTRNKQSISVVEKLAASKAASKAKVGHYLKQNGKWVKK